MKRLQIGLIVLAVGLAGCERGDSGTTDVERGPAGIADAVVMATSLEARIVEASCGQCQLGLDGEGCELAIRFDGRALFVRGVDIDDHGDAHAEDGFCNAVRSARVSGTVEDGQFVATAFELVETSAAVDDAEPGETP